MKQTNNALTFLMAQYRAIFKNAYFKGIASALVLTAGLAAGQNAAAGDTNAIIVDAGAASTAVSGNGFTDWKDASGNVYTGTTTINGAAKITSGNKKYYDRITIASGGKLTNETGGEILLGGKLTIEKGGELSLTTAGVPIFLQKRDDLDYGGTIINNNKMTLGSATANVSVEVHQVTLASGSTTSLRGSGAASPDQGIFNGNATYLYAGWPGANKDSSFKINAGATVNVNTNAYIATSSDAIIEINGNVNLKAEGANKFAGIRATDAYKNTTKDWYDSTKATNSTVNINSGAKINVNNASSGFAFIIAPEVNIKDGASIKVNSGELYLDGDIAHTQKSSEAFKGGNSAGIFTMTGGTVEVGSSGTLIIGNGKFEADNAATTDVDEKNMVTTFKVNGGTLTNAGTLDIRGVVDFAQNQTFDKGIILLNKSGSGKFTVDSNNTNYTFDGGKIVVSSGILTINKGVTLKGANDDNDATGSQIDVKSAMVIEGAVLQSYLGVNGSTLVESGANVTVNGTFVLDGAKLGEKPSDTPAENPTAPVTNTVKLASGGTLTIAAKGELQAKNDAYIEEGATLAIADGATLNIDGGSVYVNKGKLAISNGSNLKFSDSGNLQATDTALDISAVSVSSGSSGTLTASGESGSITFGTFASGTTLGLAAVSGGKIIGQKYEVDAKGISGGGSSNIIIESGSSVELGTLNITGYDAATPEGTLIVTESITNTTKAGDGDIRFTKGTLQLGATDGSTTSGTVGSNLVVGNGNITNVFGTWKAADKKVEVAGTLNVGSDTTSGNLSIAEIAQDANASGINVNKDSTLTVEGVETKADDFKAGDNGYYGFGLSGATVNVNGGTFVIGSTATGVLINDAWKSGSTTAGETDYIYDNFGKYDLASGAGTLKLTFASGTTFDVEHFTQLKKELLDLGSTVDTNGNILAGTLTLENVTVEGLADSIIDENEETGEKTADYSQFVNSPITGADLKEFEDVQLTDVNGPVNGANVGSLELANGTTEATISGGDSSLASAVEDTDGNAALIVDSKGAVAGATIEGGASLTLKDTGAVGDVDLTKGTDKRDSTLALVNKDAANAQTNTIASVNGLDKDNKLIDSTAFVVGSTDTEKGAGAVNATVANGVAAGTVSTTANSSLTVVSGDVVANTLANNGNLTLSDASGSVSTGIYTSAADSALTAQTVTIDGIGTKDNASVVAGEITVNSDVKDVDNPGFVLASQAAADGSITKAQLAGKVNAADTVAQLTNADVVKGGELNAFSASLDNGNVAGTINVKYDNSAEGAEADDVGFALKGIIKDGKLQAAQISGAVNADKTVAALERANVANGGTVNAVKANLFGTDIAAGGTINVKSTDSGSVGFTMASGLINDQTKQPIPAQLNGTVDAKDTGAFLSNVAIGESGSLTATSVNYADTIDVAGKVTTANTFIGQEKSTSGEGEDEVVTNPGYVANVTFSSNNDLGNVTFANYTTEDGAGSSLTIKADVTAGKVTGNANSFIQVGSAGESGASGYLAADNINLEGGIWQIDPAFGKAAAVGATATVGKDTPAEGTAGTLNFQIRALQNSIVAIGVDKEGAREALYGDEVFGAYLDKTTNSLDPEKSGVGAILYVAKPVKVAAGQKIIVSSELTDADVSRNSTGDVVKSDSKLATLNDAINANDAYIGAGGAVAVNAGSAQKEGTAAITFDKPDATIFAAENSKIVLVGDFDPSKSVTIFTDTKDGVEFASGSSAENLTVLSAGNKFSGEAVLNDKGELVISGLEIVDTASVWAGVSSPVKATLEDYYDKFMPNDTEDDPASGILYYSLKHEAFDVAEKVARLGAFGGAAQTAIAAGSTTYEAVSGRMGIGANGTNITVADNTQGAALWLTPVYKNRDSDGFGADGVDYGTDLDLYGVALGADYTLANGFKIGAAFNIGSGDADGNGAGDGVNNDFDYYGFAIYGSYTYGPWSVVADVSYTTVDNDVDVDTDLGKFDTSFDSSNLSIGVTAQYQAVLEGDVTVTPHAGLRYTKIDLDDYTVKFEDGDDVAAYSSDDLSIFSIPFGVTVAKEFVNGTWTVKPSFDLTLTANMGDDSADGSVYWGEGINNTVVSSEVLDNFTYGATVGVAAKSGNFSLGFGLNYTGSSNTDEFGVNANARFVF